MKDYRKEFADKSVLITGELGFIGSSIAIRLVEKGASVTIMDAMISDYGGNLFNVKPAEKKVKINFSDLADANSMNYLVRKKDYIFHCGGQVCHIMGLTNPFPDIDYNIEETAILLVACRKFNPEVKIIKMGPGENTPGSETSRR